LLPASGHGNLVKVWGCRVRKSNSFVFFEGTVKRSPFACLLLATVASPAFADDLTISTITKTPVATATASNNSPGNITIDSTGGIDITTAGAAVVLNSNNTIDSSGIIQNTFTGDGARGIHILGGNTGSLVTDVVTSSVINVAGGGSGNYGILVDGAGGFTGNITLGTVSTIVVTGPNATGIGIQTPLIGNLTVGANTTVTGLNANGVVVLSPVSGQISVQGNLAAVGTTTYTLDKVDPLSGSALAVASNVGGGIVVTGPATSTDTSSAASVVSSGTVPAFAIQPSIAGASASSIVISAASSDTTNPSYSVINRGGVRATSNDPGISTIAVGIGEIGSAAQTVTLAGGIFNRGTIQAQAETDNTFAVSAPAASATATAILIGNGAIINASALTPEALFSEGTIAAFVNGNKPATGTGVLIASGGSLPVLTNTGLLEAITTTTDTTIASLTAYGIRDLSGTLRTINNSGSLFTSATVLDNGAQLTVAADLSHGTQAETFTNSGSVIGDILFGSGANQLVIEGATTLNNCTAACVHGMVRATGAGTLDVSISPNGGGGFLRTASSTIRNLGVGSGGTLELSIDKTSGAAPALLATGASNFAIGSSVTVVPTTFLPNSGTFTLVRSNGGLTFADFSSTVAVAIPFIFKGSVTQQGNDLLLALQRKTATELGLVGNDAAIYEPLAAAALKDDEFGAALLSLNSNQEVQAALNSTVPDIAGGVRALSIAMTDQATGVIAARERSLVTAPPNTRNEFRFWGQEFYNNVNNNSTAASPGYNGAGQGIALGGEWGNLSTGRYGVGYTFFSSQEVETHPRDTKTDGEWNLLSFYAGWRTGDFFVTPQANIGEGSFHTRRTIAAGTVVRSAAADFTSYLGAGGVTTGYIIDTGAFQIIPQIAFDGLWLHEGTYAEDGGGGVGLTLKSQNQDSIRSFAGVLGQGTYKFDTGSLQPQLLVGWTHEFKTSPATIDGSFEAAPGSPFHLVGPTLEPNHIVGGASFAYVLGNWSAGINYDASASTGSLAQSATVSLSSRF
jgi:hypothetical protein